MHEVDALDLRETDEAEFPGHFLSLPQLFFRGNEHTLFVATRPFDDVFATFQHLHSAPIEVEDETRLGVPHCGNGHIRGGQGIDGRDDRRSQLHLFGSRHDEEREHRLHQKRSDELQPDRPFDLTGSRTGVRTESLWS